MYVRPKLTFVSFFYVFLHLPLKQQINLKKMSQFLWLMLYWLWRASIYFQAKSWQMSNSLKKGNFLNFLSFPLCVSKFYTWSHLKKSLFSPVIMALSVAVDIHTSQSYLSAHFLRKMIFSTEPNLHKIRTFSRLMWLQQ